MASDQHSVTVGTALVIGPADRRIVEYAVADPEGVIPRSTSSLASKAWNVLRGRAGPYYLLRASVTVRAEAAAARIADQLLAVVLPRVLAQARSS